MKIGLVGLGKMGAQIAERLLANNHEVVVTDINQAAVQRAASLGASPVISREDMLENLDNPAVIWLMIPSDLVQTEIDAWLQLLPPKSILIDGGNSDFRQTRTRAELAARKQVDLIDIGTSGGVSGLKNGFSMMIGGSNEAFALIEPIIASLAQPDGYRHFGESGSGHFIKMVHNAIEYGIMESYAEGYRMLVDGPYESLDIAAISKVWQHGSIIGSALNQDIQEILHENPTLDGFDGFVSESGEARWTLELAEERNIPMSAIKAAFDVRIASQAGDTNYGTKLLAAMRNKFGGHNKNK